MYTINIFYIFAKTAIKMKENEIARLFIRFIRENNLKIRYNNDLFNYLMNDTKGDDYDDFNRKRFKELGYNIVAYISHKYRMNGYDRDGYDLPLNYAMTWKNTEHGHKFWRVINLNWRKFYGIHTKHKRQ